MTKVFVGLGSNRGDRKGQLEEALAALDRLPETAVAAVSSVYDSKPVGDAGDRDFLNAAAVLETRLEPRRLLERLLAIEKDSGRPDRERRGTRTLDLDLLFYGEQVIDEPGLQIPHPRIADRSFVLLPLTELEPRWTHPQVGLTMSELLGSGRRLTAVRRVNRFDFVPQTAARS